MYLILLLLSLSCSQKQALNHHSVKEVFIGNNCIETLKSHMAAAGCSQLYYKHLSEVDIMFRCAKDDADRGEFWDNYIFRVSPAWLTYTAADKKVIMEHTICMDHEIRLEAYPPEDVDTKVK